MSAAFLGAGRNAAEEAPVSLHAKFNEAEQLRINGDYDSALPLYRQLVAAEEGNINARVALGMTLGFIGEFDESISELEKSTQQAAPGTIDAGWADLNLGKTYQMLGMFEESKTPLQKVLDNPNSDPRHRDEAEKQIAYLREFGL